MNERIQRLFTCKQCGIIFESTWTEEEAAEESARLFGKRQQLVVVCDVCFKAMAKRYGWPVVEGGA